VTPAGAVTDCPPTIRWSRLEIQPDLPRVEL